MCVAFFFSVLSHCRLPKGVSEQNALEATDPVWQTQPHPSLQATSEQQPRGYVVSTQIYEGINQITNRWTLWRRFSALVILFLKQTLTRWEGEGEGDECKMTNIQVEPNDNSHKNTTGRDTEQQAGTYTLKPIYSSDVGSMTGLSNSVYVKGTIISDLTSTPMTKK